MAYAPDRGIAVVPINRLPVWVKLIPRERFAEESRSGLRAQYTAQSGTPWGMARDVLFAPSGLPCSPPPWGLLHGIDLATGDVRWSVPLGTFPGLEQVPGADAWGSAILGGPMVTAGGLAFIAATMDDTIRALDIETGEELWSAPLPAGGNAIPMSYIGADGRQYVVIAAGGHGNLGTTPGDYVVAFAL
jgi:quinoprotein glucose dehydrogenase